MSLLWKSITRRSAVSLAFLPAFANLLGGCPNSSDAAPNQNDNQTASNTNQNAPDSDQLPPAPVLQTLTAGDGQIELRWSAVADATGYLLRWRTVDADWTETTLGLDTTFVHRNLSNGRWHCYELRSVNAAGASQSPAGGCGIPQPVLARHPINDVLPAVQDAILRDYIRQLANQRGYVYTTDLTTLEFVNGGTDWERDAIRDLSGIGVFNALSKLTLANHKIVSVAPLAELTRLTELILQNNQINDPSPLSYLSGLNALDLSGNQITDAASLAERLIFLHTLVLSRNRIADFSPLASYRGATLSLEQQLINGDGPTHVDALADLPAIGRLSLRSNPGMACAEVQALLDALKLATVEIYDPSGACANVVTPGCNCTQ